MSSDGDADGDEPAGPQLTGSDAAGSAEIPVYVRLELGDGKDMARVALNRAKAAARGRGYRPGQEARRRTPLEPARGGAGVHPRDPLLVTDSLAALLRDRGWSQDVSVGGVIGRWREVVGDQVADHCEPESFEAGVLTVRTDSTAWATHMKVLGPKMLGRLAQDLGDGVVREVRVLGPAGPGFKRGPRSVPGRGPRDTWG